MTSAAELYEHEVPDLGKAFLSEVRRAVELIESRPRIGSQISRDTRRSLLRRFPYSVIYGLDEDQLVIVAIAHHRRRPGYWRERRQR